MVDLVVHEIFWCGRHGQPIVSLHLAGTDRFFAVAMAAEDASLLAPEPPATASGRVRLYEMMESAVTGLGGGITEVQLSVGDTAMLQAAVRIAGPDGELTLPAHFADGIALAHRQRVPLRMTDADVARVPPSTIPKPAPPAAQTHHRDLTPFRDLIESLDLDEFGPSGRS
jgi:bifunctional DNase/RNase